MPYHQRTTDNPNWFTEKLKIVPLALAIISLIGFLFVLSARVNSLEAGEASTKDDLKEINEAMSEIKAQTSAIDAKLQLIRDDLGYVKSKF